MEPDISERDPLRAWLTTPRQYPQGANADEAWARVARASGIVTDEGARSPHAYPAHRSGASPLTSRQPIKSPGVWRGLVALGATCVAVFAVAVSWIIPRASSPASADVSHTYRTASGQRSTVTLADGSRAVLGPATTLDVRSNRSGTTVTVNGAALFMVQHHPDAPFTVRTGTSVTRVLGTTFLVRHYATDAHTRVAVSDGRVSVQSAYEANRSAVLAAGALAMVDDSGHVAVTPHVDMRQYTAWTDGDLVFRDTPLREILGDLGRAYGVNIRLADSALAARPITWNVQTGRYPLAQALHELTMILGAHVVQSDSNVTIVPGRCALRRSTPKSSPLPSEAQYGR